MGKILKVLNNLTGVRLERDLKCAACGSDFTCGASLKGCWCSEIELTSETRAQLRSLYTDCLCRDCLEKAQNGQA